MKKSKYIFILVLGLLGWVCMDAKAGPITTFEFSGYITNIADPTNLLNGQVQLGAPFQGSFSVDTSTADDDPSDGGRGTYPDAITVVGGAAGPFGFSGPLTESEIDVRDGSALDHVFYAANIEYVNLEMDFVIVLVDGTGTALNSDAIPLLSPDLDNFEFANINIYDRSESIPLAIQGALTTFVPEPTSLALLFVFVSLGVLISKKKMGCIVKVLTFCAVLGTIAANTRATDCNANGIVDADEVSSTGDCKVDVIVVFDTSTSMGSPLVGDLCATANNVAAYIGSLGADVFLQKLAITSGNQTAPCTAAG